MDDVLKIFPRPGAIIARAGRRAAMARSGSMAPRVLTDFRPLRFMRAGA